MKNIILLFLTTVFIFSYQNIKAQEGFVLNGTIHGMSDSTIIELISESTRKIIDSTFVINEEFQFSGKVDKPTEMFVAERNTRNYKAIWIENNIMTFEAQFDKLKTAKITGSSTQKDDDILFSRVWPLSIYVDSIFQIMFPDTLPKNVYDSLNSERNNSFEKLDIINQEFIKEYPNSLISVATLNGSKLSWDKELVKNLYKPLSIENKKSEEGRAIAHYLKINKPVDIWDKYIDFTQFDANGKKVKLSDIKGKYILVEFWASWCGFCRKENPNLIEQYNLYKSKGFEVLGVSFDNNKERWLDAIKKDKLPWVNVSDLKGNENEAKLIYGISGIPRNILINEKGIIVAKDLRGEALVNELRIRFKD